MQNIFIHHAETFNDMWWLLWMLEHVFVNAKQESVE